MAARGHASSMATLSLQTMAKSAPNVSFIHDFPGPVKSGIARGTTGPIFLAMKAVMALLGPFVYVPNTESGERHLYLATSARYPADKAGDEAPGVPLEDGVEVARGTKMEVGFIPLTGMARVQVLRWRVSWLSLWTKEWTRRSGIISRASSSESQELYLHKMLFQCFLCSCHRSIVNVYR